MATDKTDELDVLLMEAQAAKRLNVSPRTLQNWRIKGIGYIRAGRMIRYRAKDLTAWLTVKTVSSDALAGAAKGASSPFYGLLIRI